MIRRGEAGKKWREAKTEQKISPYIEPQAQGTCTKRIKKVSLWVLRSFDTSFIILNNHRLLTSYSLKFPYLVKKWWHRLPYEIRAEWIKTILQGGVSLPEKGWFPCAPLLLTAFLDTPSSTLPKHHRNVFPTDKHPEPPCHLSSSFTKMSIVQEARMLLILSSHYQPFSS